MLRAILSDDLPRSRWLAVALVAILVGLAVAPFLFPGAKSLNVAAKICVFIVLAASFDLLLGYTGIVSFAHTMFFGIGAYGVAIALTRMGAGWAAVAVGIVAGLALAVVLAAAIGLFSLRVRTIFFAMITLAGVPLLANFFHPDRWLLWLGVAFILCVYFFPTGIVGRLRQRR